MICCGYRGRMLALVLQRFTADVQKQIVVFAPYCALFLLCFSSRELIVGSLIASSRHSCLGQFTTTTLNLMNLLF
jgi:hypothetical protein